MRDQFLMIRDSDGKDPIALGRQLCRYYEERNLEEIDKLPRVRPENVLILKYYSFENYFLNPQVMARLHIVESEEAFYETLLEKWNEYLHRLSQRAALTGSTGQKSGNNSRYQGTYGGHQDLYPRTQFIRYFLRQI